MRTRCITTALACLAALPVLAGNVYKWTDAQGQTHYTQTPPPKGVMAESARSQGQLQPGVTMAAPAKPAPAPAPPAPGAAADPKAPPPETKEAKAKRCADARARVTFLEERPANRLMIQQPDGSESRMTEEQYNERMAKAKEAGKGC